MGTRLLNGVAYFLGLLFLISAIGKVFTYSSFISQCTKFDLFSEYYLPTLVVFLIIVEMMCGASFFFTVTRKYGSIVASILLVEFIVLSIYAKSVELDQNCGCFGFYELKMASLSHFIQNGMLLILTCLIYSKTNFREKVL